MTGAPAAAARLNPAVRLLWRSPQSIQLELGDAAVVVDGATAPAVRELATTPASGPADRHDRTTQHALRALAEAGYLWPPAVEEDDERLAPPRPRLAAELAALSACHGERGAELLNARRHVSVAVHGPGRVGPQLAALLAAAGVGRVHVLDNGVVRLQQALPGGVAPSDEGTALPYAAARAIERAAPDVDTTPLPNGERPDLVVLAYDTPVQPEHRDALHASDCAHLVVRLGPDHGVVGPLVIPGLTSCLRCADLHRLDRDPAWTALAVQLADGRPGAGSGVGVAAIVGGIAAVQALAFLDGGEPAVVDGTLELRLPDWRIRRRSWPAHPDCDCARPA